MSLCFQRNHMTFAKAHPAQMIFITNNCNSIRLPITRVMQVQINFMLSYIGPQCNNGAVRFTDGYSNNNGFAEVCIEGEWIGICKSDMYGYRIDYDTSMALLMCNQLGYQRKNVCNITMHGTFTATVIATLLHNVLILNVIKGSHASNIN